MIVIVALFGICAAMLYGLAMLTGTSYNDVSVVINIFVEPFLCILLMILALLSIFKKDREAVMALSIFKHTVWALVAIGIISLVYGVFWFHGVADQIHGFRCGRVFSYSINQWHDFAYQVQRLLPAGIYSKNFIFTVIRDYLLNLSYHTGMTYEALNILIYVVAELFSLLMFWLAYRQNHLKLIYFSIGVVFFIVSILPTLFLISQTV